MKQVLVRQGAVAVEDVPQPQVADGAVLVQVSHSCISIGTEMSGIRASGLPLWKRVLKNSENIKKAIKIVADNGLARTREMAAERAAIGMPTGYSAAGVVVEVGAGVNDLKPGDRVACAGAQCAHHAEYICVPRNLVVGVPEGMDFAEASTVALGSIALQGVRRAAPTMGETFVVVGLGILGQMTVQLLKTNGCRVVGTDLDRSRIEMARQYGMDVGVHPDDGDDVAQAQRLTDGVGADGVIITAASKSDAVISTAFKMCRKKGRVVLVGDVALNLLREDFYQKELDFLISTSYGPGRYDRRYEEEQCDYPVAYVRWTENRNMAEYLRLVAEGRVKIGPLITKSYDIAQAVAAYEALKSPADKPLMVLLTYPGAGKGEEKEKAVVRFSACANRRDGKVSLAIVGAGSFARATHLPNLRTLSDRYRVHAIMDRAGLNASEVTRYAGANYATTDYQQILKDSDVDAVLITTRHDLHAPMAMQALEAGKHVLVEKPLAVDAAELATVRTWCEGRGAKAPVLLTGFNRRFSRYARRIHELVEGRSNPMIVNYRMNAGYIPLDHWVHTKEGAGRNVGEACHIYDLFTYLTGSRVTSVSAKAVKPASAHYSHQDNFVATMTFGDGSVANLVYTALGSITYPKERMEIFVDGKVLVLDDFRKLEVHGMRAGGIETKQMDKGHREELEAFAGAITNGGEWPNALWQQCQAMEIAFEVERQLMAGTNR